MRYLMALTLLTAVLAPAAHADFRTRAAAETAEMLMARFGARAGKSLPALTRQIEGLAARYGDEAILALRKAGPATFSLVEAAGVDGAKAVRVLARYGEEGAARIVSRPTAMQQFLKFGDEAASVLVRHPGVAEPLVERGGAAAVKALSTITPRSGRRMAMMLEGELAQAGKHPELMEMVAKYGEKSVDFLWQNKGTLAGGAALTAILVNPEPFINGTRDIAQVAGQHVVAPVVSGFFTLLNVVLTAVVILVGIIAVLIYKFGPPRLETCTTVLGLFKK